MAGNLEKRIKRHILSKTYRFLGVTQPAFRDTAKKELKEEGFEVVREVEGGIEFEGDLQEGWRANLVLRTISRVYCRIDSFRAGAREELYRKARGIPWELWIHPKGVLRVESSAHASRIHHEGVIRETLMEAIYDRWEEAGFSVNTQHIPRTVKDIKGIVPAKFQEHGGEEQEEPIQRVLVHSERHQCTISLDMSGDGLYRRGYRSIPGEAPIREDLAAALLMELGWKGKGILCDPMTGSGTFAIEAALIGVRIPPGWNRRFQFQDWPSFRENRWAFIKKQTISQHRSPLLGNEKPFCFASDQEMSALEAARVNSRSAGVEEFILFEQKDFFSLNAEYVMSRLEKGEKEGKDTCERFLVLNPPYGKRLEVDRTYHLHLWEHIRKNFPHWKVLLLLPASIDLSHRSREIGKRILFRHGGLRVQAFLFETD
ncbi:MAG: hypothetical protein N2442_07125 [Spirochaetes bacterium]|nr:hypothetical protein [Spirochaetota bacterium]